MFVRVVVAAAIFALASTAIVPAAGTLDYDFYKAKVQPIFLVKRPGHAPCVMCHADANNMLRLEKLPDRGADAQEFRHGGEDRAGGGRSARLEDLAASAGAGSRRRRFPFRRPAIRLQERSQLEDHRPMGAGRDAGAGEEVTLLGPAAFCAMMA
jgi:hypothetical protein